MLSSITGKVGAPTNTRHSMGDRIRSRQVQTQQEAQAVLQARRADVQARHDQDRQELLSHYEHFGLGAGGAALAPTVSDRDNSNSANDYRRGGRAITAAPVTQVARAEEQGRKDLDAFLAQRKQTHGSNKHAGPAFSANVALPVESSLAQNMFSDRNRDGGNRTLDADARDLIFGGANTEYTGEQRAGPHMPMPPPPPPASAITREHIFGGASETERDERLRLRRERIEAEQRGAVQRAQGAANDQLAFQNPDSARSQYQHRGDTVSMAALDPFALARANAASLVDNQDQASSQGRAAALPPPSSQLAQVGARRVTDGGAVQDEKEYWPFGRTRSAQRRRQMADARAEDYKRFHEAKRQLEAQSPRRRVHNYDADVGVSLPIHDHKLPREEAKLRSEKYRRELEMQIAEHKSPNKRGYKHRDRGGRGDGGGGGGGDGHSGPRRRITDNVGLLLDPNLVTGVDIEEMKRKQKNARAEDYARALREQMRDKEDREGRRFPRRGSADDHNRGYFGAAGMEFGEDGDVSRRERRQKAEIYARDLRSQMDQKTRGGRRGRGADSGAGGGGGFMSGFQGLASESQEIREKLRRQRQYHDDLDAQIASQTRGGALKDLRSRVRAHSAGRVRGPPVGDLVSPFAVDDGYGRGTERRDARLINNHERHGDVIGARGVDARPRHGDFEPMAMSPHRPRLMGGMNAATAEYSRDPSPLPMLEGPLPPQPNQVRNAWVSEAVPSMRQQQHPMNPFAGASAAGPPRRRLIGHAGGLAHAGAAHDSSATVPGIIGGDEHARAADANDRKAEYRRMLEEQMQANRRRKVEEKEASNRREAHDAAFRQNYNPFGRGGGGAPLLDAQGTVVTNLKGRNAFDGVNVYNMTTFGRGGAGGAGGGLGAQVPTGAYGYGVGAAVASGGAPSSFGPGPTPTSFGTGPTPGTGGGGARGTFMSNMRDLRAGLTDEQRSKKQAQMSVYQRELEQQIREKKARQEAEKQKKKEEEEKEEREIQAYWRKQATENANGGSDEPPVGSGLPAHRPSGAPQKGANGSALPHGGGLGAPKGGPADVAGGNFTRFRHDQLDPVAFDELQQKTGKAKAIKSVLAKQIEDKKRRKLEEELREREAEAKLDAKLERDRKEMAARYAASSDGPHSQRAQAGPHRQPSATSAVDRNAIFGGGAERQPLDGVRTSAESQPPFPVQAAMASLQDYRDGVPGQREPMTGMGDAFAFDAPAQSHSLSDWHADRDSKTLVDDFSNLKQQLRSQQESLQQRLRMQEGSVWELREQMKHAFMEREKARRELFAMDNQYCAGDDARFEQQQREQAMMPTFEYGGGPSADDDVVLQAADSWNGDLEDLATSLNPPRGVDAAGGRDATQRASGGRFSPSLKSHSRFVYPPTNYDRDTRVSRRRQGQRSRNGSRNSPELADRKLQDLHSLGNKLGDGSVSDRHEKADRSPPSIDMSVSAHTTLSAANSSDQLVLNFLKDKRNEDGRWSSRGERSGPKGERKRQQPTAETPSVSLDLSAGAGPAGADPRGVAVRGNDFEASITRMSNVSGVARDDSCAEPSVSGGRRSEPSMRGTSEWVDAPRGLRA